MTKKDYKAIAEVFRQKVSSSSDDYYTNQSVGMLQDVAEGLCIVFKQDNPSFDKQRFLDACGF